MDQQINSGTKQQYLYSEIIEQGYNPEEFMSYLSSKNPEGLSIENISFEELRLIVINYKQANVQLGQNEFQGKHQEYICNKLEEKYTKKLIEKDKQENNKEENKEISLNQFIESEFEVFDLNTLREQNKEEEQQMINIEKYGCFQSYYKKQIQCVQEIPLIHFYNKTSVEICEPEKRSGGYFGLTAGYLTYKITVKPHNWEVRRKNQDFNTIRDILQKVFPGKIIPPLKNKRSVNSDKARIDKQMKYLQKFILDLREDEEIWCNEYLISFLSEQSIQKFEEKMKDSEKIQFNRSLKKFTSMSGKVNLLISNSSYCFAEESSKFIDQAQLIYQKLKIQSKQLKKEFDQISETMFNIGQLFHQLFTNFNDFDSKIIEKREENQNLKDCFINFNNIMMTWGNMMTAQIKFINESICSLFNYGEKEIESAKYLFRSFSENESQYFKYKQKLNAKKEKLFSQGEILKWEIGHNVTYQPEVIINNKDLAFKVMCSKESSYENHLKDQFAYYCFMVSEQVSKYFKKITKDYSKFFSEFSVSQIKNMEDLMEGSSKELIRKQQNVFSMMKNLVGS